MKISTSASVLAALPWLLLAAGCETLTPRLDHSFGDAVNMAKARQTFDRDATAKNANRGASGLDGVAANEAMLRYEKSFRTPEPVPNVFSMGISGTSTGGSASGQ